MVGALLQVQRPPLSVTFLLALLYPVVSLRRSKEGSRA